MAKKKGSIGSLVGGEYFLPFFQSLNGFHDLLRENRSCLLMIAWSSISVTSLMIQSMCLDLLARIIVILQDTVALPLPLYTISYSEI
jgi:hypothetical protein